MAGAKFTNLSLQITPNKEDGKKNIGAKAASKMLLKMTSGLQKQKTATIITTETASAAKTATINNCSNKGTALESTYMQQQHL